MREVKQIVVDIDNLKKVFTEHSVLDEKISEHKVLIIKNYKSLCKILNIEYRRGNTKYSQLKQLSAYFSFEEVEITSNIKQHYYGTETSKGKPKAYIIYEIYDIPIPIEYIYNPTRLLTKISICNILLEHTDYYECTAGQLASMVGFVNNVFVNYKNHVGKFVNTYVKNENNPYYTRNNVIKMFDYIMNKYNYRIKSTIQEMEKTLALKSFEVSLRGVKINPNLLESELIHSLDEYGDKTYSYEVPLENEFVEFTKDDISEYTDMKFKLLTEEFYKYDDDGNRVPCDTYQDLFSKRTRTYTKRSKPTLFEEFNYRFSKLIKSRWDCDYVFSFFKFYYKNENIKQILKKYISFSEVTQKLNETFLNDMKINKEKKYNEALEIITFKKSKRIIKTDEFKEESANLQNKLSCEMHLLDLLITLPFDK